MRKKNLVLLSTLTLSLVLGMGSAAFAYDGIYPSTTNLPTNNNLTLGAASTTMFGNPQKGLEVYNTNCTPCHGPSTASKGIGNIANTNTDLNVDPGLYDINPAIFARNLEPMIQHGSKPPEAAPITMPAWGDTGALSQTQIADVEAWIMSNSNVKWPTLSLDGTTLSGNGFVPGSSVQVYQDGTALNGTATADASGNLTISSVNLPTGKSGNFTAHYATLNVPGVYVNNDKTKTELAMDGNKGATYTVAVANYAPSVAAANMPKTGSNSIILALVGAVFAAIGGFTLFRKPRFNK